MAHDSRPSLTFCFVSKFDGGDRRRADRYQPNGARERCTPHLNCDSGDAQAGYKPGGWGLLGGCALRLGQGAYKALGRR